MTENNEDSCYICLTNEKNLRRPCGNTQCTARICFECITKQYQTENKKCGICQSAIVKTENKKFDLSTCCEWYIKLFYILFMTIGGSIGLVLLALGRTVTTPWIECGPPDKTPCDSLGAGWLIFFVLVFSLMFWQFPLCYMTNTKNDKLFYCWKYNIFCCKSIKNKIRYKSYITMAIMYVIACLLILLAHLIGYPIVKSLFGHNLPFSWRSCVAGMLVYCIIVGFIILCLIIFGTVRCIYRSTVDNFSAVETDFGVIVDMESESAVLTQ